tara:strand:- start:12236 stop:12616 length:381 start_codon:yes stop_codon:yes gene_type:complete
MASTEKQKGKMDVLLELNQANASLHDSRVETVDDQQQLPADDKIQKMYELFGNYFRKYMSYYPGDKDIRFMPMDSVDVKSTIHSQALQHIRAKRYNVNDTAPVSSFTPYTQLIDIYSKELYLEHKD